MTLKGVYLKDSSIANFYFLHSQIIEKVVPMKKDFPVQELVLPVEELTVQEMPPSQFFSFVTE